MLCWFQTHLLLLAAPVTLQRVTVGNVIAEYLVVVGTGRALVGKEECVAAVAESKFLCAVSLRAPL